MTGKEPGADPFAPTGSPAAPESSATHVPAGDTAVALLDEGVQAERLGDLTRAISAFTAAARSANPAIAAEALTRLADAWRSRGDWEQAMDAVRRSREIARAAHLDLVMAYAMVGEAAILMSRGCFPDAKQLLEEVLIVATDPRMRGLALQNIGAILAQRGELGAAERCFAESFGHFQRAGYRRGEATALLNYGCACLDRGNLSLAEDLLSQAAMTAREAEQTELMATASLNLAEVRTRQGDLGRAEDLASEALGFFRGSGNRWWESKCLRLIGEINEQRGDLENAMSCYERGFRLAQEVGAAVESRSLNECLVRVRRKRKR